MDKQTLPLSQLALSVVDVTRSELFWGEGLGFLPAAGTRLFNGSMLSGVTGMPSAAATTWWMIDRSDWVQLEIWQYDNPVAALMPQDYKPNAIGYSRCGVWVSDFDGTLARLSEQDIQPLTDAMGTAGERRVCVRCPDGIYVEIMEKDPLGEAAVAHPECNVALRSVTLSTPNLEGSLKSLCEGMGIPDHDKELHTDEHEALWGLSGAQCERQTLNTGPVLIEVVQYTSPLGIPRRLGERLNDQGILNIAIGDAKSSKRWKQVVDQAMKANWLPAKAIKSPLGGCNYFTDPQRFNVEVMWARPGLGHTLTGFDPKPRSKYPNPGNQSVVQSVDLSVAVEEVWEVLADHEGMSSWAGLGNVRITSEGFNGANGVGLQRSVHTPVGVVLEQIFEWTPNKQIGYRIIEGGPFSSYTGHVELHPQGKGCRVVWKVKFRSRTFGAGPILKAVLSSKIRKMLVEGLPKELANRGLA